MIEMEREVNQCIWESFLGDMGLYNGYENDTFCVRTYDWSDTDSLNDWHFWHKPSGLKVQWYKYPLRGCMWNIPLTHGGFAEVLKDCHNSMEEGKQTKFLYDCNEWWDENQEE